MTTSAIRQESSRIEIRESIGEVQAETASSWNYTLPVVSVVVWVGFWCSLGVYIDGGAHNYKYPNNPINPAIITASKNAMISLGSIGAATIPASFGATILRSGYRGCLQISEGVKATSAAVCKAIKESCTYTSFGQPQGIIINTLAAPIAVPLALVWGAIHLS